MCQRSGAIFGIRSFWYATLFLLALSLWGLWVELKIGSDYRNVYLVQGVPSTLLIARDPIHGDPRDRCKLSTNVDEFADGSDARHLAIEVA